VRFADVIGESTRRVNRDGLVALGTTVPKVEEQETQKARLPIRSDKQAFLSVTNHTELELRGENFYGAVRFRESKP
jgi:hypothetical protein